jgi:hypothetical protein
MKGFGMKVGWFVVFSAFSFLLASSEAKTPEVGVFRRMAMSRKKACQIEIGHAPTI